MHFVINTVKHSNADITGGTVAPVMMMLTVSTFGSIDDELIGSLDSSLEDDGICEEEDIGCSPLHPVNKKRTNKVDAYLIFMGLSPLLNVFYHLY